MRTFPNPVLTATAAEAADGGTVLHLDLDRDRPGSAAAVVLRGEELVEVTLDAGIGVATVSPMRAPVAVA